MLKKIVFTFLFIFIAISAFSQYNIRGVISNNETGNPLPGANISIINSYMATSANSTGEFTIKGLGPGIYHLKISYIGFKTVKKEVEVRQNLELNISLHPEVYMSEEVIISAIRAGGETPTTYTVLNADQLEKQNFGRDLPYMMQTMPSTVVTSDAGNGIGYTNVRIRGTDLTGINVTMNGVPLNDPESHAVFFVDLPDLASSIDDMKVQRGVGSSSNGSASFGASINIKTGEFQTKPYGEIGSAAGSFNTFKNTIKLGTGLIKEKWAFDGRVSFVQSDGYVDRASSNLNSFYLTGGYYGKKDVVKLIVVDGNEKTYQAWYGIPKDSLETNRTYNPAGEIFDEEGNFLGYYDNQTDNYRQTYYQAHYAHEFSRQLNVSSSFFYTRGLGYYENYKNAEKYADYGLTDPVIGNDTILRSDMITQKWLDNHFYGLNISLNYNLSRLKLNVGTGWNRYDGDHYGKVIWAQYAALGLFDKDWYFNTGIKTDFNIFAKADYRITDQINMYVDLQYRRINYEIEGTHDDLSDLAQAHIYNFFNPKIGLNYIFNQSNSIYAYVGIANREPNRSVFRDADPEQDVKPEKLTDYELGYKYSRSFLSLEANLFYMDYKDQLVLTGKINNVGAPIMTNVLDSYRTGIEFMGGVKFLKIVNWYLNATYSLNKINNFTAYVDNWNYWDDPESEPYQFEKELGTTDISYSPEFTLSSEMNVEPFSNFKVALVSNYVSRQYIDNTSNIDRSIDPYLVNNLRFVYSIKTNFIKQIDLLLTLNNILNAKYETNAWVYRYVYEGEEGVLNGYFPQAEFNFMAGINLKF
ncbi:MAG: TonB-dependent receptor [Bacteroidetes bacterium]|nr:TonB-dependent receptor [Bacteroidota bacterium]